MTSITPAVASAVAEKPYFKEPGIRGTIIVTGSITRGYWSDAFDLAEAVVRKLWEEDMGIHGYDLKWDGEDRSNAIALLTIDAEGRDIDEDTRDLWDRVTKALHTIPSMHQWRITNREVRPEVVG
jgi:hypothetical protein